MSGGILIENDLGFCFFQTCKMKVIFSVFVKRNIVLSVGGRRIRHNGLTERKAQAKGLRDEMSGVPFLSVLLLS